MAQTSLGLSHEENIAPTMHSDCTYLTLMNMNMFLLVCKMSTGKVSSQVSIVKATFISRNQISCALPSRLLSAL